MTVTQRLYQAARPVWEACHAHPFVRGIGDGTLPLEQFRWFLLQDYRYLFDYARVFAYGVIKARDPELMRIFSVNLDAILGGEMRLHRAYMARLGIPEAQVFAVQPALANLSYTHYMLAVAAAGGPAGREVRVHHGDLRRPQKPGKDPASAHFGPMPAQPGGGGPAGQAA